MADPGRHEPKASPPDIAQAGAIAGAIFAALLAADPLNLQTRAHWAKWFDYTAFGLWVAAVVLFILAVAEPDSRLVVNKRNGKLWPWRAGRVVALAGAATIVALLLSVVHGSADTDNVSLQLTSNARAYIDEVCGTKQKQTLYATVETGSLEHQFVTVTLVPKTPNKCDQIRLRADEIISLVEHP